MTPPPHTSPFRDQDGSALIEVMVSAVVLLIAIVSLFLVLDAQTTASGDARRSTGAAALAEADQERLRSFSVPELSNRREVRTVTVAGIDYSVDSRVDWIRDATGGTQSCANSSTQADYLRLTSTVTGRTGGVSPPAPIVLRSLVAPPVGQFGTGQGTLAVKVEGGAGQPIQGASTTVTGPASFSDVTNELGCAVFGYVPVGNYSPRLSVAGFVDPSGSATPTGSATVSEGTVNAINMRYDRAGAVAVSFDTKVGPVVKPATGGSLSAGNVGVPSPGFRLYRPGSPQGTISATALFPFASSPYVFYSGSCAAANPALYLPTYYDTNPGDVVVAPGGSSAVTVREPALNLTVTTATAGASVHVRARAIDTGCTDVFDWTVTTTTAGKTATLPEPGLPFGRYQVCADSGGLKTTVADVPLKDPNGSAAVGINLTSAAGRTSGVCT